MKVLVIGSNGQLGTDIEELSSKDHDVFGLTHDKMEITDSTSVTHSLTVIKPQIVINTAAFHNLPVCESNPIKSYNINAIGAYNLSMACNKIGSVLVHYSTDYVFDGGKRAPYLECDPANPLNIYGASKLAGEQLIRTYSDKYYIIRISGIYGKIPCRAKGGNFISNIVKSSREKSEIKVVNDEILTPTPTCEIAKNTLMLISSSAFGTYHMTCEGQCSWYEFTKLIFKELNIKTPLIECSVNDFPSSIKRPSYSVLENRNLKKISLNSMPDWEASLISFLRQNYI